ncbi:uncharacterized protein [Lolium perenne]|uniref:uncharacterized protein n=1 Tax=Lolium perenne TaxID=4522 RepID=UPI0021F5ADDC|nr:uncharacterized protein LOC127302750 [Lolium perenne]
MLLPSSACPLAEARADAEELRAASLLPSWPHLGAVYDVLVAAVADADAKSLRAHVNHRCRTALLAIFAPEDPRDTPSPPWIAPSCAAPWRTPSSCSPTRPRHCPPPPLLRVFQD